MTVSHHQCSWLFPNGPPCRTWCMGYISSDWHSLPWCPRTFPQAEMRAIALRLCTWNGNSSPYHTPHIRRPKHFYVLHERTGNYFGSRYIKSCLHSTKWKAPYHPRILNRHYTNYGGRRPLPVICTTYTLWAQSKNE